MYFHWPMYTYARRKPGPGGLQPPLLKIEKMSISAQQLKLPCLTSSQRINLDLKMACLASTPAAQYVSKMVLCRRSAIGIDGLGVCDEHSANFASIAELVFLRMILQHTEESPEEFARASLHEVHKHGPKIRVLPGQIICLQTHGATGGRHGNARKKFTIICYTQATRENSRPLRSSG